MPDLVVARIKTQQVLDCAQRLQIGEVVARNIDVLEVAVLLNAVDCGEAGLLHADREESMPRIVESLANLVKAFFEDSLVESLFVWVVSFSIGQLHLHNNLNSKGWGFGVLGSLAVR